MTLSCPGPPVTFQSLAPAAAASTAPAPRSPSLQAANMEELLKGIPPNVSIPTTADQQTGGQLVDIRAVTIFRDIFTTGESS